MKRAYVKPAFIAEAFEMTESVAICDRHIGQGGNHPFEIDFNTKICSGDQGHKISKGEITSEDSPLWQYAVKEDNTAYLFDGLNTTCDFVWLGPSNGEDRVQVWGQSPDKLAANASDRKSLFDWLGNQMSFMKFFGGCEAGENNHGLNYKTFCLWS